MNRQRLAKTLHLLRAWILGDPGRLGHPVGRADIQLGALRLVLGACLVLGAAVGLHSAVTALLLGRWWVLPLVAAVLLTLGAAIARARLRRRRQGALLLVLTVYVAAVAISISGAGRPEITGLGHVLGYATPLVAGLLINWRLAVGLMGLNTLLFLLMAVGWQPPQLPPRLIQLPHSSLYIHAALFMFFNLCLPLAVLRIVAGMGAIQQRLNAARELSDEVFQVGAPTLVCDEHDRVQRANRPFLALCGLRDEQALRDQPVTALLLTPDGRPAPPGLSPEEGSRWWLVPAPQDGPDGVPGGGRRKVLLRSRPTIARRLRAYRFDDVTELRRTQADLAAAVQRESFATWHDPLTGLANRSRCIQWLDARRGDGRLALLTLRIGNLRQLNARYGVAVGDRLLQGLVRALLPRLPEAALAARVRGSVLAVLLPDAAADGREALLAQVQALRERLPARTEAEQQAVVLDLGFGIAAEPAHADGPPVAGAELLRRSELALDLAQDARWRERFEGIGLFDADIAQSVARSMAIEAALPQALHGGELHLLYQPQLRPDGRLLGFEALARWHSPVLGVVSPAEFVPVAEACGLICGITDWVLEQACAQMAQWCATQAGAAPLRVAVNLSARDLERRDLFEVVDASLRRHGLGAAQLELEVTESSLARQPALALQQLRRLHEAGLRLAIDDFGTGYSSLAQLVDLPVAVLKIDRSFLHQLPGDARRERVVRSIVSLAHRLELEVVAEGIEEAAQTQLMRALGVQGLQGYLFGRPERAAHWQALIGHGGLAAETIGA